MNSELGFSKRNFTPVCVASPLSLVALARLPFHRNSGVKPFVTSEKEAYLRGRSLLFSSPRRGVSMTIFRKSALDKF